jgi:hypothetical protein
LQSIKFPIDFQTPNRQDQKQSQRQAQTNVFDLNFNFSYESKNIDVHPNGIFIKIQQNQSNDLKKLQIYKLLQENPRFTLTDFDWVFLKGQELSPFEVSVIKNLYLVFWPTKRFDVFACLGDPS